MKSQSTAQIDMGQFDSDEEAYYQLYMELASM